MEYFHHSETPLRNEKMLMQFDYRYDTRSLLPDLWHVGSKVEKEGFAEIKYKM